MFEVPPQHRAFAEVVERSKFPGSAADPQVLAELKAARDRDDWVAVAGLVDWLVAGR